MTELVIHVYGDPAPQGSKRHVGGGRMIESSAKVAPWRQDVKAAAEKAIEPYRGAGIYPLDGAIVVRAVFSLRRPPSVARRRRPRPSRVPDLSKLIRSTEDALTSAGVWADDSRVVEYERLAKVYTNEDPEALDTPGALLIIRTLDDLAHSGEIIVRRQTVLREVPVEDVEDSLRLSEWWAA